MSLETILQILNVIAFLIGIFAASVVLKHSDFFANAQGKELAHRVRLVFFGQFLVLLSISFYCLAAIMIPDLYEEYLIRIILRVFQIVTMTFSAWSSLHLYSLYKKYKG